MSALQLAEDRIRQLIREELRKVGDGGGASVSQPESYGYSGAGGSSEGDAGGTGADYSGDGGSAGADYSGDGGSAGADYSGDGGGIGSDYSGDGGSTSGDGSGDTATPSYITIAANGAVTADFSGVLAGNLILPALAGAPSAATTGTVAVTSDGTPTGTLLALLYDTFASHDSSFIIQVLNDIDSSIARLRLDSSSNNPKSELGVFGTSTSGFLTLELIANVVSLVFNNATTLFDANGKSEFIRNAASGTLPANRHLDWGSLQITSAANTTFNINHNLGSAPDMYMAALLGLNGYCYGVTANNSQLGFRSSVALANTFVTWIAGLG